MPPEEKKKNGQQLQLPPEDQPPSVLSTPELASILIPCCGQLEYTKLCVPSILRHTRQPYELIFIDIGSLDGTAAYLAGVAARTTQSRVEMIRTVTDLGIPEAVERLQVLANDTGFRFQQADVLAVEIE